MLPGLPAYVTLTFVISLLLVLFFLGWAVKKSDEIAHKRWFSLLFGCIAVWILLQFWLGWTGFYRHYNEIPPRFLLAVLPPLLFIVFVLKYRPALLYAKSMPLNLLTWLHVARIPVELVLYWCFVQGAIPEIMTFGGRNFDILAGLTAPLVAYYGAEKGILQKKHLLLWNLICLGLLFNIVLTAVLSAPFPFQRFGFAQPNIAVFYSPFILLPAFIVPAVLFCHLLAILKLWGNSH